MKIKIQSLSLRNFKGIKSLDINFNDITDIFGANGTGKTTIVDAFNFLLWGKNSQGQKEFEIKTLDSNNNPIHKLEHEVSGVLIVDEKTINLKRIYKETWTKKRGEATETFTGHETIYYIDDVPLKQSEYQARINNIVDENLFKLLSNTGYFSSLKWQEQRSILIGLAGEVDNNSLIESIATPVNDFTNTVKIINSGKSLEDFKKEIAAKKKKIKDELELIPARIDEAKRSMPENTDFTSIEGLLKQKQSELESVLKALSDISEAAKQANQAKLETQNKIFSLRSKRLDIENTIKSGIRNTGSETKTKIEELLYKKTSASNAIARLNFEIDNANTSNVNLESTKSTLLSKRESLLKTWNEINSRTFQFDEDECKCPTCSQMLPETDRLSRRKEFETNFNAETERLKESNKSQGLQVKNEIEKIEESIKSNLSNIDYCKSEIEKHNTEITSIDAQIESLKANEQVVDVDAQIKSSIESSEEIKSIDTEIKGLEASLQTETKIEVDNQKDQQRLTLQSEIAELNKQLGNKAVVESTNKRIEELEEMNRSMSNELAGLEKQEFEMQLFIKAKMDIIEQRVNAMFKLVKFKMFERQINGGEAECCECLINGVPYSSANTASKMNAGLDIINTLSLANNVSIPVFIDNRESVSEIMSMNGQVINLYVSPQHNQLTF